MGAESRALVGLRSGSEKGQKMSLHVSILRHRWFLAISLVLLMGLLPIFVGGKPASGATNLPDGFEQSQVTTGLTRPTAMEFAPDGRLFVAEKEGRLRVIDENNGGLQTQPFVDISGQVSSRGE